MFDLRAKAHCCNIYGRMANKVLPFLLATHGIPRPVFLFMLPTGDETDADLKQREILCKWASSYDRKAELKIITSTEGRAMANADAVAAVTGGPKPEASPKLAPLILREDHSSSAPASASFKKRTSESFTKKFGESVSDLVVRLEPIVLELEGATQPVLVIAQEAPCRTLRAYLLKSKLAELSHRGDIDGSLVSGANATPTLVEFNFTTDGECTEKQHTLGADGANGWKW